MHTVNQVAGHPWGALVRTRELAREKAVVGWLRISCFLAILFHHTVLVPYEFLDGRMLVVWLDTLRDFGVVGFFLIAGASLKAKVLANPRTKVSSAVLLKVLLAALALGAFNMAWELARGNTVMPLHKAFYSNLYESNLWFLLAYAFAGPLLIALDARAALLTALCGLVLVMFPGFGYDVQSSPYILHSIALAYICMYVGFRSYGWQLRPGVAALIAAATFLGRVWLDDYGVPLYPPLDAALRLAYGLAAFHLLKSAADWVIPRFAAPRLANFLFVPYVIQYALVPVMTQVAKPLVTLSLHPPAVLVFGTFAEAFGHMFLVFVLTAVASFGIAAFMSRHDIRI
jgi:hypothetical protein